MKKIKLPKSKRPTYSSFVDSYGALENYFQPSVFCDTSFLLDYWNSDKHDPKYLVHHFNKPDKHKETLDKYFDPDKKTKKLFELRNIIDNYQTNYHFIYSPACRFELEEIITYNRFKNFVTENHDITAVEKKGRKDIGSIVNKVKLDFEKEPDNASQELRDLYFFLCQTTSEINEGLPAFIEADIVKVNFTKKDFYKFSVFANQQIGFADIFHLITAKRLRCKYFFTFDNDFELCKKDIKEQFDLIVLTKIDDMIKTVRK